MTGETDLKTLLSSCEAMMADDEYVFACVKDMIHTISVERGTPSLDTMHLITFGQEKFGKIRTILTGHSCDQCSFHTVNLTSSSLPTEL